MKTDKGFTLLIAIVITATLLLVSTGIVSVAVKEAFLSSSARESQHAFYAADTGIECAAYWDLVGIEGVSAFSTTTSGVTINCNGQSIVPTEQGDISTFSFNFAPLPYCAVVTVTKSVNSTVVQSRGYNTCDSTNSRRVERGVSIGY